MQTVERFVRVVTLALIATALLAATPTSLAADGGAMLYLVQFEATEAGAPTSPEQAVELLEQLILPSLERLSKDSRVVAGGLVVGARAGAMIVEAKSNDEVTEIVRALPAWGVMNWKVTPLESFGHRIELERQLVQQLRAQAE